MNAGLPAFPILGRAVTVDGKRVIEYATADGRRFRCYPDGPSKGQLIEVATEIEAEPEPEPPYPWCPGNPTREACTKLGYCTRNPNCGE